MTLITSLVSAQTNGDGFGNAAIRWHMTGCATFCGSGRFNSLHVLCVIELRIEAE